jgi:hypothetical protein
MKKLPTQQFLGKTNKLFNIDLHLAVITDVKHTLKALYGDKEHVMYWSICGKDGTEFVFEKPTQRLWTMWLMLKCK